MKRPNGYGSVTKMSGARRKPYAVRVSQRDAKGRIMSKYLSFHATQQEAFAALEAYNQNRKAGLAPPPESLGVTLQEVYDLWSARKYKTIGASAARIYQSSWIGKLKIPPLCGTKTEYCCFGSFT